MLGGYVKRLCRVDIVFDREREDDGDRAADVGRRLG